MKIGKFEYKKINKQWYCKSDDNDIWWKVSEGIVRNIMKEYKDKRKV